MKALVITALLVAAPATADSVRISSCFDGDTCRTNVGERIRLACIDTPEMGEPGALAARDRLRELAIGQEVTVRRITTDRYGRTIAELHAGGQNIGEQLVSEGHARVYRRYAHQCSWSR